MAKAILVGQSTSGTGQTAPVNTNDTRLATTAFVNAEIANDAAPKNHVGATGTSVHGVATTSVAGFLSTTDKTKLDAALELKATPTAGYFDRATTIGGDTTTRINYNGNFYATKVFNAIYNDYAEYFKKDEPTEPGDIVELNLNGDGYIKSKTYASKLVRGVHSDTYGHLLGGHGKEDDDDNFIPLALCGRVKVKILGEAKKGQYIVTSDMPGVGIAINEYIPGAVIGQVEEDKDSYGVSRIWMFIRV